MERPQGHINHISCGEQMGLECLEQEGALSYHIYENPMSSNRHGHMPFLHMLLEEQSEQHELSEPGSFQLLLRHQEERLREQQLQHQWPLPSSASSHPAAEVGATCPRPRPLELPSCVTYKSETLSETRDHPYQHQRHSLGRIRNPTGATASPVEIAATTPAGATQAVSTEKKRKRSRPPPRDGEVENQRRTHIAVERHRRKLMNSHLCALRSLMPSSFIQRGDQASIIGGAIEYVKELEQLLQSLLAEKRTRVQRSTSSDAGGALISPASSSVLAAGDTCHTSPFHDFFTSPQYCMSPSPSRASSTPPSWSPSSSSSSSRVMKPDEELLAEAWCGGNAGGSAAGRTAVADIEATVVQTHVNLKILSPQRPAGQLQRAISALDDLHLSVLHLNITSFHCSVLYSFNLKIEEECKLGSAEEIAAAAHQIFSLINLTC